MQPLRLQETLQWGTDATSEQYPEVITANLDRMLSANSDFERQLKEVEAFGIYRLLSPPSGNFWR